MTNPLISTIAPEDQISATIAGFFNAATITVTGVLALLTIAATI